jgi:hypothetical protein
MSGDGTVIATMAGGVVFYAANNETVIHGPTQLTMTYNENVKNDNSTGVANNTANYLLVEEATKSVFDTLSFLGGPRIDGVQKQSQCDRY